MHTIRQKTKTRLYTLAIPLLLAIQIIIVMLLFSSCGSNLAASVNSAGSESTSEQVVLDNDDEDYYWEVEFDESADLDEDEYEYVDTVDDGDYVDVDTTESDEPVQTYILNTNTHKFHYPNCRSVKQMKDKNKLELEAKREEVIAKGYDPCGNCNP